MDTFLSWLAGNKEWLFSGIGAAALAGFFAFFKKPKDDESKQKVKNTNTGNSVVVNFSGHSNTQSSSSNGEMDLERRKEVTHIVFVDDDTKFKIIKILQNAGWVNTRIIKDVDNLDAELIVKAHILFIDINGVGSKLGFKDAGLGLALSLKRKYPEKKVVIYSTESKGDRFHEALRKVDTFLSKNAEPFEFLELIDQLSADIKNL